MAMPQRGCSKIPLGDLGVCYIFLKGFTQIKSVIIRCHHCHPCSIFAGPSRLSGLLHQQSYSQKIKKGTVSNSFHFP